MNLLLMDSILWRCKSNNTMKMIFNVFIIIKLNVKTYMKCCVCYFLYDYYLILNWLNFINDFY